MAKWQTHETQNLAVATPCRFESDPRYQGLNMNECVFCQIKEKKLPAAWVFEDDQVFVIKDRSPQAPIHYLIIPKEHVIDIRSLLPDQLKLGALIFKTAQHLARTVQEAEQFNLFMNNGPNAGQKVFHLHAHFLAGRLLTNL